MTSLDVARIAGVSQATVSRVLAGSDKVLPATRERVERALRETSYAPDALARAMKTRRTGTIGVVVARITNPFYPEVLRALSRRLAAQDLRMIVWDEEGPGEVGAVEAIRQRLVDGLIFTTVTPRSAPLEEAVRRGAPVVLLNRTVDSVACDQAACDNVGGGRTVARYLHDAGHHRIGFIGGPMAASTARERERGFREALGAAGLDIASLPSERGDFTHHGGWEIAMRMLTRPAPPTALFCVNDLTAFGALDAAKALGIHVPDALWVVGFDDIEMAAWEAFDLTTVRQPITSMVDAAVDLLVRRLDQPDRLPEHQTFPARLVVRGSTARTAATSEEG